MFATGFLYFGGMSFNPHKYVFIKKQKICSKYHQLFQKCNSLHVSISCDVELIDFNNMDSIMQALRKSDPDMENDFHEIERLFDVLPNFVFFTSETMRDF